ncbi:MAG: hypothetical protein PWP46_1697 [Fusobacteriaceae bacterium]|nr:hypothetical protein [Fusobacteriales bacterium]MDN5304811.1 hypothetical protein [Fusobacteriaceae bacterium]
MNNSKQIFLLFSHTLTENQINELKRDFNINKIFYLPKDIQNIWSNVDYVKYDFSNLKPIKNFIKENSKEKDYILIQGEYGYTYHMVNWAFENKFIPIYATTQRKTIEIIDENNPNNIKKISHFEHISFRKYIK